ncbi:hypothetical protein [Comamonas thiooxydans]|uniref:hypothetical protein n=1 Tax=Comamonas thiooxydans TaxID=363952 RepID=UPI0011867DB3|nr:hypothetical protein [Comamonas thiooxydans]
MRHKFIAIAFMSGLAYQAGYASELELPAKSLCDRRLSNISAVSWKYIAAREVKKLDVPLTQINAAVQVQGVSSNAPKKLVESELITKLMGRKFQFSINNDTPGVLVTFELLCVKEITFPEIPRTGYNISHNLYEVDPQGSVRLSFKSGTKGLEILVSTTLTKGSTILSKTSSIYQVQE